MKVLELLEGIDENKSVKVEYNFLLDTIENEDGIEACIYGANDEEDMSVQVRSRWCGEFGNMRFDTFGKACDALYEMGFRF